MSDSTGWILKKYSSYDVVKWHTDKTEDNPAGDSMHNILEAKVFPSKSAAESAGGRGDQAIPLYPQIEKPAPGSVLDVIIGHVASVGEETRAFALGKKLGERKGWHRCSYAMEKWAAENGEPPDEA